MIWKGEQTMAKVTIRYTDYFTQTIQRMREDGLLLATSGADGKANVMTIGWGAIGAIWGRPVFLVLVRPSRHTYSCLEEVGEFTVNVPPRELATGVNLCGTVSGRDHDKFREARLTPAASRQVRPPIIQECVVHYECRILHKNDVVPGALVQAILDDAYAQGDFHRMYSGEIVAAYADQDAAQRLSEAAAGALPMARP
jgi:flavin reductase (DIM6/NTAB) family NADH-FMN oxidoreductase RutF